ncbi:MAG: hypothetical protein JXL97_06745 [Bacteroidales bacterium]|nr:hypothetical protein [Bacteroidales bacterium]
MTEKPNLKFVSWYILAVLVAAFLFIRQYVFPEISSFPEKVPDGLMFYSSDELFDIIGNYSAKEIRGYIVASLSFDIIYPLIYGTMLFVLISLVFRLLKLKSKWVLMVSCLPFISTFLDYSENVILIFMLKKLPEFNENLASFVGFITMFKYLFIGISVIAAMIVVNYTISYRIRHSVKK